MVPTAFVFLLASLAAVTNGRPLINAHMRYRNVTNELHARAPEDCPRTQTLVLPPFGRTLNSKTRKPPQRTTGCFGFCFGRRPSRPAAPAGEKYELVLYEDGDTESDICQYRIPPEWYPPGGQPYTAITPRPDLDFTEKGWDTRTRFSNSFGGVKRDEQNEIPWVFIPGAPLRSYPQWTEWVAQRTNCEDVINDIVGAVYDSLDEGAIPTELRLFDNPNVYFRLVAHQLGAGVMGAMDKAETAIRVSSNEQDVKDLIRELLGRENICEQGGFPTIDLDLSQSGGNQKDDGGSQANNGGSFLSPQDDTDADDQDHRDGQKSQANNGDKGKEPQDDTDDDNQDYMDREESDPANE